MIQRLFLFSMLVVWPSLTANAQSCYDLLAGQTCEELMGASWGPDFGCTGCTQTIPSYCLNYTQYQRSNQRAVWQYRGGAAVPVTSGGYPTAIYQTLWCADLGSCNSECVWDSVTGQNRCFAYFYKYGVSDDAVAGAPCPE